MGKQVGRIDLNDEQAFIFDTFTRKTAVEIDGEPEAHEVWLDVGPQHFRVCEFMENAESADWMRAQLAKALFSVWSSDLHDPDALIAALEK